jgi:hypothetical protein
LELIWDFNVVCIENIINSSDCTQLLAAAVMHLTAQMIEIECASERVVDDSSMGQVRERIV